MRDILFFSDPHLGVNRFSNTTAESRLRLKEGVVTATKQLLLEHRKVFKVCLGDFFDTYNNTENDLIDALHVFSHVDLCLAGNHDVVNDKTKRGSLDLLSRADSGEKVVRAEVGEVLFKQVRVGEAVLIVIPHHSSQALFETAMQQALVWTETGRQPGDTSFLLLHCNYNMTEVMKGADTALNLPESDAKVLLEVFDYVLLGHDHTPKDFFNGRLRIVGNIFPTSFSDISSKRALLWRADSRKFEEVPLWLEQAGYIEIKVDQLLDDPGLTVPVDASFAKVIGATDSDKVGELGRCLSRLWANNPGLLAVRNSTELRRQEKEVTQVADGLEISLPDMIDRALLGTPMYPLWQELRQEVVS